MVFQKTYCTSGATWHSVFVFVFVLVFVFVCVFSLFCKILLLLCRSWVEYVQPPLSASNPMILEARSREKSIVKARKRAREREKPKPKVKARAGAGILFHLSIPITLNSHCSTCSRMSPKFIAGSSLSQKKVSAAALQRKMTVKLTTGT